MSQIRGQGYYGARNMKGGIKGLKTLIIQESPFTYYIHCFAHQLQLLLVVVAKGNTDCKTSFDQLSLLLNTVELSCKRHGMLRNSRLEHITKALDCGELETGTRLNQEMGLPRPGDTRWGTHTSRDVVINDVALSSLKMPEWSQLVFCDVFVTILVRSLRWRHICSSVTKLVFSS
jgi:hypothetical protein